MRDVLLALVAGAVGGAFAVLAAGAFGLGWLIVQWRLSERRTKRAKR